MAFCERPLQTQGHSMAMRVQLSKALFMCSNTEYSLSRSLLCVFSYGPGTRTAALPPPMCSSSHERQSRGYSEGEGSRCSGTARVPTKTPLKPESGGCIRDGAIGTPVSISNLTGSVSVSTPSCAANGSRVPPPVSGQNTDRNRWSAENLPWTRCVPALSLRPTIQWGNSRRRPVEYLRC
jgi:hypothetical protein